MDVVSIYKDSQSGYFAGDEVFFIKVKIKADRYEHFKVSNPKNIFKIDCTLSENIFEQTVREVGLSISFEEVPDQLNNVIKNYIRVEKIKTLKLN